jgi:predicted adenylyl cyclase CyaB
MARNVEIKARVADLNAVRLRARSLSPTAGVLLEQTDTFFAVPDGRLKIREFGDGPGELIAYDRADTAGPKESVYSRVAFDDVAAVTHALTMVLPVRGRVRKRREVFVVGRTRVHLDDVEGLGSFVELEVVLEDHESVAAGRREAEVLMERLSIPASSLVSGAYIDLLDQAGSSQ